MRSQPSGGSSRPIAAITGATGYVGSLVSCGLAEAGFEIRRLVRTPEPDSDDHRFDLSEGCSPSALQGVDVLVHCAYDFSVTSPAAIWQSNVFGTRSLLALAESNAIRRTIFISSMSAYAGTRQIYGRAKLASESDALASHMCVVRPGLIYGPTWGGMAGTLKSLTSLPLVPVVGRNAHQFTVHEDDLRDAVVALALADAVPRHPLGLANPEPVNFDLLLRTIARANGRAGIRLLPLPWQPIYWALRAVELSPAVMPLRADSLLGLVRPAPAVPATTELSKLGIAFRPLNV